MGIGEWRTHLPYRNTIAVDYTGKLVYCATQYNIFYYDKSDQNVGRLTKVNGLSDIGISKIKYNKIHQVLVVAYTNANIDLIYEDRIVNISDIKRKSIYGNKTINNIAFFGDYVYLSCGFGIVVVDIIKNEIKDTYLIGPNGTLLNVFNVACDGNTMVAATEKGLYRADYLNSNLANYASWIKDLSIPNPNAAYNNVTFYQNKLFTNLWVNIYAQDTMFVFDGGSWKIFDTTRYEDVFDMRISEGNLLISYNNSVVIYDENLSIVEIVWNYNPGTVTPKGAIMDEEGNYWIADNFEGLVRYKLWQAEKIILNGPGNTDVYAMDIAGSSLYVAPGGVSSSWGNVWNTSGVFSFINDTWHVLKDNNQAFDTLFDVITVAINPTDHNHVFAGSYAMGLAEIKNGYVVNVYNKDNSGLENPFSFYDWLGISGLAFDKDNNLWIANSACSQLLKVLKPDGTWQGFSVTPYLNQARTSKIMIDQNNQKWVLLTNTPGLLVFNEKGTFTNPSDDVIRVLTSSIGNGNLPSNLVLSFAEDMDGKVWIGTDKGVAVFYNPQKITEGGNFDAQVVTILQDSVAQHLLEFESVTAIAVDGSNKKWFGTEKAGVFLMSEDGQEQILNFTTENSPLLSNTISSIVIDDNTGEVYFGTANGIISYKAFATAGVEDMNMVYAYPNPVREGFNGNIGIKGLVKDASVKITDVSGTLVFETISEGGQAIWNGKNFSGNKVKSGVYFVFCSSEDGKDKLATKIMVIH